MMKNDAVVDVRDLVVQRGEVRAVDGISFSTRPGEVTGLLSMAAQAGSLLLRMSPFVRAVQVLNELPSVAVSDGILVELGSFYSGEVRKLVLTFDVPGIPALGLAEIATLEFTYIALPMLEQHTVTVPLHVNVVPGDQAAGRERIGWRAP